jgi:uncharacterized repeat protein (TIGR01451 family)
MWSSRLRIMCSAFALAVIVGMGQVASAATLSASVGPSDSSPLVVGQSGAPGTLTITNTSSGTGPVTVTNIQLDTACNTSSIFFNGTNFVCGGTAFPGVITLSATGTGTSSLGGANATCVGTWTIALNAGTGIATFTGPSGALILSTTPQESCTVAFTMGAAQMPPPGTETSATVFSNAGIMISATDLGSGALLGPGPETGFSQTTIESCGAALDKQVSCDGGVSWQDVTGVDDTTGATNGCIANSGAPIMTRFVVTNTGGTPISSCVLSDSPAVNNPLIFLSGNTNLSTLTPGAMSTTSGAAGLTCSLTSGQNGTNTASLSGCICPTSTNTVAIATQTDTATIACAGVKVDKEISCNAGVSFQDNTGGTGGEAGTGLVTHNEDGTNGCTAASGLPGQIEAKFLAKSLGNAALTCGLMDTNTNFIPAPVSSIALANNAVTPVGPGTTSGMECLAARSVGGSVKEPDTATLTCSVNPMIGVVDKTTTGSLTVFDSATFNCIAPMFTTSKTCTPTSPGATTFSANVTVNNTDSSGGSTLSCAVSDSFFSGMCPASQPAPIPFTSLPGSSIGTVLITPSPLSVGAGLTSTSGSGTFTSATTVCNQAMVTCTPTLVGGPTLPALPPQFAIAQCTAAPPMTGIKLKKLFNADAILPGPGSVSFTVINQGNTTLTGIGFSDVLPAGLTETGVSGSCGAGSTFTFSAPTATLAGGTLAAGASCTLTVNFTAAGPTGVRVCDTTSPITSDQATGTPATACLTIGPTPIAPLDAYQALYAANLNIGDSVINLSNTGALSGTSPAGDLCVNVYAFDPREELIACCTCVVTPDGLNSISVTGDLIRNPLTPNIPTSIMIKLITNLTDPGTCNVTPGFQNLQSGTVAWGTTIEPSSGFTGSGDPAGSHYGVVRVPAKQAQLSPSELSGLTQVCNFIRQDGTGFGICNSCRLGGLAGAKQ